ncbi:MAG: hypothetical protein ACHRXM_32000 [Isosphaerales bacterium]
MEPGLTDNRRGNYSSAPVDDMSDGLTDDLRARVKSELEPGERLLWAARSDPPIQPVGAGFYACSAITLLLIGVALGFSVLGYTDAQGHDHVGDQSAISVGLTFLGWSCVFVIGLVLVWRSRVREHRRKANVCYAITDRRAIIWAPEPKGDAIRVQAVARGQVKNVVRLERPDGSGSLEFSGDRGDFAFAWPPFGFKHIPEVRRVEQIIRNNLIKSEQGPLS